MGRDLLVPSSGATCGFPGFLIRGGIEYSGNIGKVIAYIDGKFQVVFKEGYDMHLVDVDFDGIPEIISADFPTGDVGSPSWFQVWTWNGHQYVKVAHVRLTQIFSPEVVKAVKGIKREKQNHSAATKH